MLNIHFSRVADLAAPDHIVISPSVPISCYRDGFGNWCSRILAPAGHVRLSTDAVVTDTGQFDPVVLDAGQIAVEKLPDEAIVFLLASRFCDSDRLLDLAWTLFKDTRPGWARAPHQCLAVRLFDGGHDVCTRRSNNPSLKRPGIPVAQPE